jgi:hypothetical protein
MDFRFPNNPILRKKPLSRSRGYFFAFMRNFRRDYCPCSLALYIYLMADL